MILFIPIFYTCYFLKHSVSQGIFKALQIFPVRVNVRCYSQAIAALADVDAVFEKFRRQGRGLDAGQASTLKVRCAHVLRDCFEALSGQYLFYFSIRFRQVLRDRRDSPIVDDLQSLYGTGDV